MGKEVLLEMDAYPDEVFTGKITTVNPMVDPHSRTFKIKIDIPNPDFRLESGMFARIRIIKRESKMPFSFPSVLSLVGSVKRYLRWKTAGLVEKTNYYRHPESSHNRSDRGDSKKVISW